MKTKPVILLAAISALLITGATAQQDAPPGGVPPLPPPGAPPRPPGPPREGDAPNPGSRRDGDAPRPPGGPREGESRRPGGPREGGDKTPDGPRDGGGRGPAGPQGGGGLRFGPNPGPGGTREGFQIQIGEGRPGEPGPGGPRGGERPGAPAKTEARAYLGVAVAPLPPVLASQLSLAEGFGLAVLDVAADSPAAKAGVQKYDVIKLLNDQQIVDQGQLSTLVAALGKGKEVSLTVLRKAQEQKIAVTLGEHSVTVGGGPGPGGPAGFGRAPGFGGLSGSGIFSSGGAPHDPRELQERAHKLEEHARDMQRRLREGQPAGPRDGDKPSRDGGDKPAPRDGVGKPGAAIDPLRLLQEAQIGGGSQIRVESTTGTTTIDGAQASLRLTDSTGAIEVSSIDGKRVLTARDPEGKVVFTGPVNTEEERAAVPEIHRKKLEQIHIRQGANGIGTVVTTETSVAVETPNAANFE